MNESRFVPVELAGFPDLQTAEVFGERRPDMFAFAGALTGQLGSELGVGIEQVTLFNGGESRNGVAIVYGDDRTIQYVEFSGGGNLQKWFVALAKPFGGSTEHQVRVSGTSGGRFSDWDGLLSDPEKWAKKHAPTSFSRKSIRSAKDAYFAFDTLASTSVHDPARFREAWNGLVQARHAVTTAAVHADIDALEKRVGTPLPADLRALYSSTAGIAGLFYGFDLLSADEARVQQESWCEIYEDWTLEELQDCQTAEYGVHPVYYTPRWVPFVDLVGGNFLAIDLGPATGGTYGQVITAGADVENKRVIATSVTEFLEKATTYDGTESHELFSVFEQLQF